MNIIECPNCKKALKETSFFCGKCKTQVKCLNCKETISPDDECCELCGTEVRKQGSNSEPMNRIQYDGNNLIAEFTNEVGKDVTTTIGQIFLANRETFKFKKLDSNNPNEIEVIDIQPEYVPDNKVTQSKSEFGGINSIFRESDNKLDLIETRIKASSKKDYSSRLTYLIVLYFDNKGEKAQKSVINKLIEFCGLYDGNYRSWFAKTKPHFLVNNSDVELRPAGKELALKYLKDIFDNNILGQWDLGNLKTSSNSRGQTKKETIETKKKSPRSPSGSQTPTYINSIDFHPKGADSLKDFYQKLSPASNLEKNLIFVHYLQNILKSPEIGINHIFSCYKHLGERIPGNLYQSIIDTRVKGWIDNKNMNKITIPIAGQNYFEHDLKRK